MPPKPPPDLTTIAHAVQSYAAFSVNNFAPEIILAAGFLLSVLIDVLTRRSRQKNFSIFFAIVILAIAGVFSALQWQSPNVSDIRHWKSGQMIFPYTQTLFAPTMKNGTMEGGYGMAVVDNFSVYFKLLISISGILVLLMSLASRELRERGRRLGEYSSLILGMSVGLYLMPASMDLVMMYISLELVSIAGYVLAGFSRDTEHGAEASLKYILFGALSSGLMIYGFSFFYGLTGTTNIIAIRQVLVLNAAAHSGANFYMLWSATILALAGMFYKISAVPFHFWTPDVYEGASAPVTAFLSVASKAAGFGMLVRFLLFTFPDSGKTGLPLIDWQLIMAIAAVLTMTFGNFAALQQTNVRRMLAYSSIAHAGYMLAALAIGRTIGTVAIMIYLATYVFMQLGAFYAVMLIENKTGSEEIDDYRGLAARTPLAASALVIFLLSLTGIPLTAGFIGKFYLLTALLSPNPATHQIQWLWPAIALIVNSVISLYYYLRVAAAMFLKRSLREMAIDRMNIDADRASIATPAFIRYSIPSAVLLIALIVPVIALGVYFQPLVDFASGVVRFFNFENLRY